MTLFNQMIREPQKLAEDCVQGASLEPVVKGSLFAIVAGTALFGAILGATSGSTQALYSAIKLPLAVLGTLVVSTPAFHALSALAGKPMPLRAGSALVLASLARASLALLALSPLLWLAVDGDAGYHACIELAVLLYGTAGLAAISVIVHGLQGAKHRTLATLGFLAVFLPVFAQTAWVLRPYAGRPSATSIPFVRAREGSFFDAVTTSALSMMGIYEDTYESRRRRMRYDPPIAHGPAVAAPSATHDMRALDDTRVSNDEPLTDVLERAPMVIDPDTAPIRMAPLTDDAAMSPKELP